MKVNYRWEAIDPVVTSSGEYEHPPELYCLDRAIIIRNILFNEFPAKRMPFFFRPVLLLIYYLLYNEAAHCQI